MDKQELLERANALRLEVRAKCANIEREITNILVLVAQFYGEIDQIEDR